MKRDMARRLSALVMVLLMLLPDLAGAATEKNTVVISTAEEWLAFAEACTLDSWSRGRTVELTADLDLSGQKDIMVPTFGGVFHGNGHRITGLLLNGKHSPIGLFRTVQAGAEITGLWVEGDCLPTGSKKSAGLLAGENFGTLRDCHGAGIVSASGTAGGLAGLNGEEGLISGCSNQAHVAGQTEIGGLVGRNEGTVEDCLNTGNVNTAAPTGDAPQDVGGIAGLNSGTLRNCENQGPVGYQHIGYNVGGIAGRSQGSILDSENQGQVLGRKDVGGIIGQFEPYVSLAYGESAMEKLSDELETLGGLLERFARQVSDGLDAGADDAETINQAMHQIKDVTQAAGDVAGEKGTAAYDEIYGDMKAIHTALGKLLDDSETFSEDASEALKKLREQADGFRKALDTGLDSAGGDISIMMDQLEWSGNRIEGAVEDIEKAHTAISQDLSTIQNTAKTLAETIGELAGGGSPDLEELRDALKKLGNLSLERSVKTIGTSARTLGEEVGTVLELLRDGYEDVSEDLGDARRDMREAADQISEAAADLGEASKAWSDGAIGNLRAVNEQADKIGETLDGYIQGANERWQENTELIYGQMDIISESVSAITEGAKRTNAELNLTGDAIQAQLKVVRAAVTAMTEKPELSVEDVSDEENAEPWGQVTGCQNTGTVTADSNVGGIAGNVGIDTGLDQENDLEAPEELLVDTTAILRATLRGCRNDGAVEAKNDYAGGLVGRAGVGAILNGESYGAVTAPEGYCGGIAGASRGVIRGCWVLADLTGGDYVGGIAGEGKDIAGCAAMVTVTADGEGVGAIAGAASGTVTGNLYLREERLAGIDGVDYDGKAQGLEYPEFSALPGLPGEFLHFTITFLAEGEQIKTIQADYGDTIAQSEIPPVPDREGSWGEWPEFDRLVRRSAEIAAVYTDYASVLSSGGDRPEVLVQGSFEPGARLSVEPWELPEGLLPQARTARSSFVVTLEQDGRETEGDLRIRVRCGEKEEVAYLTENGLLELLDAERDGSYLVLTVPNHARLVVLEAQKLPVPAIAGGTAAVFLLLVFLLRRGGGKKKATAVAAEEKV